MLQVQGAGLLSSDVSIFADVIEQPRADWNPNPTLAVVDTSEDFSGCLIIKDDNHWLIEWLAYHYYAARLRRLFVVQDPNSDTSSFAILERWSSRINITIWTDDDFLPGWVLKKGYQGLTLHLNRQIRFFGQCMHTLKKEKKTWLMLTDTDEFLRLSPFIGRTSSSSLPSTTSSSHHVSTSTVTKQDHILSFLQHQKVHKKCMTVARYQVRTKEENDDNHDDTMISLPFSSSGFNTSQFLTYRWLYRSDRPMHEGKNVLHLKYLQDDDIPKRVKSVHLVMPQICSPPPGERIIKQELLNHSTPSWDDDSNFLSIQHYLGSWEQFSYRDDPRNTNGIHMRLEQYKLRGEGTDVKDTTMENWLPGFMTMVGLESSQELLKNVGMLEPKPEQSRSKTIELAGETKTTPNHLQAKKNSDSIAACILIKDDNHWLIEWISYHYHVLPLRHLFVVEDPSSRTSSKPILDRWKHLIEIEYWEDNKFIPSWVQKKLSKGEITKAIFHRYRQQFFYATCLKEFKRAEVVDWVLLTDTDEFVRPNTYSNAEAPSVEGSGIVLKYLNEQVQLRGEKRQSLPPVQCLHIPRLQIAAKETTESRRLVNNGIPSIVNGTNMLTTRWLYHSREEIATGHSIDGKNIVHVKELKTDELPQKAKNVHVVIPQCPVTNGGRLPEEWLVIHHYLGTYDQYSFRDDPRDLIPGRPPRTYTLWNETGQPANVLDDSMRPWVVGFFRSVGEAAAARMLQGVGLLSSDESITTKDGNGPDKSKLAVRMLQGVRLLSSDESITTKNGNDPF